MSFFTGSLGLRPAARRVEPITDSFEPISEMQEQAPPDQADDAPAPAHSPHDTAEFAPEPGPVSLVDELREVEFPTARRGYDRLAVDAYVARISHRLAELEAAPTPQEAVRRALDDVGQQTAAILRQAQETAHDMTARAQVDSRERLESAAQQASKLVADAETEVRRLDEDTDRIWAERRRLLEDTRRLAEGLLRLADDALERFPPEADDEPKTAALAAAESEEPQAAEPEDAEPPAEAAQDAPPEVDHDDSTVEVLPPPATSAGQPDAPRPAGH